ncbi:2-dehydro-3-deoxyglucarate aldolase [Rothia kristinae]|uniref:2-dehydro-3-deoxyglucarate aldolase n=1 Tax=Rothia kristinae TaxID=37923 RepID=A0A1S2MZZ4_9MICC|nr:2-dehydro-3-deoxyglucarate aldolase [Rothia kristinae]
MASAKRPLAGMWVCSGSPAAAEIAGAAGMDWVLIDGEHSPIGLETITGLLRALAAYPATPVVRVPALDAVVIKQVLDAGAQNLLVPMVDTAEQAADAVRAVRYPPAGVRGVGSALARASRWNAVPEYLARAEGSVSLTVQIESTAAVGQAARIAAVDGVDALFVGPADLAASMGLLGQQGHPEVVAAVHRVFDAAHAAGKPVGVNCFDPERAREYARAGADFLSVTADVTLMMRGAQEAAASLR